MIPPGEAKAKISLPLHLMIDRCMLKFAPLYSRKELIAKLDEVKDRDSAATSKLQMLKSQD